MNSSGLLCSFTKSCGDNKIGTSLLSLIKCIDFVTIVVVNAQQQPVYKTKYIN